MERKEAKAVVEPRRREIVCISCPIGCRLVVTARGDEITVEGNRCNRGEVYGREEMLSPKRVVTATIATDSERIPRLPVRTTTALPKEEIDELLNEIYRKRVTLPVRRGDVIFKDFHGTGVDVVAARTIGSV